jgi:hypothetical protein
VVKKSSLEPRTPSRLTLTRDNIYTSIRCGGTFIAEKWRRDKTVHFYCMIMMQCSCLTTAIHVRTSLQRRRCIHHHLHAGIGLFWSHWRHFVLGWKLYSFHMANTLMTFQIRYFLVGGPTALCVLSYIQPIFRLLYKYLILSSSLRLFL